MTVSKSWTTPLLLLATICLQARTEPGTGIEPKVSDILGQMSAHYASLKSTTFSYNVKLDREVQERKDSVELDYSVAIERPNKISFVQGASKDGVDLLSNGQALTIFIPEVKQYVVERAPETIADALEWGALTTLTEFNSIIGELMGADPAAAILDGVSAASYSGEEELDGKKCHRIRLAQEEMDVDMWIAAGDKPYLARMSPDITTMVGREDIKISLNITLSDWAANPEISQERFSFTPPAGTTKAESFDAIFGGGEKRPADSLVGKPAPTFTLNGLDGKPIDLSAHIGKNVIVLDFWATWCGPCVRSMPVLVEVTDSFKDKGVIFIAVNLGEEPDSIKAFFQELKLSPTVALDADRVAAEKYRVDPIPQSVIIGKSGNVEAVHIGVLPVLRQQLKSQLAALVAGESLPKTTG